MAAEGMLLTGRAASFGLLGQPGPARAGLAPGLLAERGYFFAQARPPQNLCCQTES